MVRFLTDASGNILTDGSGRPLVDSSVSGRQVQVVIV